LTKFEESSNNAEMDTMNFNRLCTLTEKRPSKIEELLKLENFNKDFASTDK
jgi:hypothetical protein